MHKNIVLIGLMGAGKTSVGKYLAQQLKCEFLDTDEIIESENKCSICDIFANQGEDFFRKLETKVILNLCKKNDKIISTGGGSVENIENLNNLKNNGIVIYLKTTPEVLFERIKSQTTRPLLKTKKPLETLQNLLNKREINYLKADIIIDTTDKTQEEITQEILKVCECKQLM